MRRSPTCGGCWGCSERTTTRARSLRSRDWTSSDLSLAAWRTAGLRCDLRREGAPIALTPGIDLVGYRVIEAVLREAAESGVTSAAVTVRHRSDRLELEISGDGSIPDLERQLEGIAERIALYDGSLRRLPVGDTGFTLQAVLPLGATVHGMTIAILIADDQALVRAGFRMILEAQHDLARGR